MVIDCTWFFKNLPSITLQDMYSTNEIYVSIKPIFFSMLKINWEINDDVVLYKMIDIFRQFFTNHKKTLIGSQVCNDFSKDRCDTSTITYKNPLSNSANKNGQMFMNF